ncbi:tyrosine-type recombinase/integrase [Nocardia arizonensis]|uniref:tyrosine-type recombinase/integrase n=1 Tax=Nocardia arizonensis TaxID=1141647 RepID=UPI0006CF6ED4|nr:tyrosine-type recombinase/integrase [Nocardia arizonensis]
MWALYEAVPEHVRPAILLGMFAGLRVAEVSALRVADIDFVRGVVYPKRQWPDKPLKTAASETPIPIPRELTLLLSAVHEKWSHDHMVTNGEGMPLPPWIIERRVRELREAGAVPGLPDEFSFHDLRHFFASLLISKGAPTSRRFRHGFATPAPRRRSTLTGTCGRTQTSPPASRSVK